MDKWFVLVAWSARLFFYSGCMKANGVLLDDMVAYIGTTHSMVAWAFALQNGVALLTTPITSVLLKVFTKRQLAVSGGFLVGFSYVCCGLWMVSLWQLFVIYFASGVGFGLQILTGYLTLKEHFEEEFPLMISIASMFNFVGLASVPPFLQYLKDVFGMKDSLIIFGATLWNLSAIGLAYKPVKKLAEGETEESTSKSTHCPKLNNLENVMKKTTVRTLVGRNIHSYLTVFAHDNLMIYMAMECLMSYIYISWALFLVSLGTSTGLHQEQAVLLSTCGGIGGFLGKVIAVALFHFDKMDAYTSCLIPLTLNSVFLCGCAVIKHFYVLAGLTLVSGLCQGVNSSGIIGLLPSMVCKHHLEPAVVISAILEGIVLQLGGLISGIIRDKMGSTIYVFGFDAFLCLLSLPLVLRWACTSQPKVINR